MHKHRLGTKKQGALFREGEKVRKQIGTIRSKISRLEERLGNLCTPRFTPIRVDWSLSKPKVQQIELGFSHTICIVREFRGEAPSRIFTWGCNEFGQLGLGDYENRYVPCELRTPKSTICCIAAGYAHSGFVCTEGFVYTFGSASRHRL